MPTPESTRPARILLVEDEAKTRASIREGFLLEGWTVTEAADGDEAAALLTAGGHDLCVIDRMLPGRDGIELVRQLRACGDATPVLMLTARGLLQDRVQGLDGGADDYLSKPFAFSELIARCRALLRRSAGRSEPAITVGPVRLDPRSQEVTVGGAAISLTPLEFRLLNYLFHHRCRAVPQAELSENLYSHDHERDPNAVEALVARLRRKLKVDVIETRRGFGYIVQAPRA